MAALSFSQNMHRLAPYGGVSRAFSRFLEVAVKLNCGSGDGSFQDFVRYFDKRERYIFIEAYTSLVLEMTGDGSGLVDVLGEFYGCNIGTAFPDQK